MSDLHQKERRRIHAKWARVGLLMGLDGEDSVAMAELLERSIRCRLVLIPPGLLDVHAADNWILGPLRG